jgi:hypothetical protein
MANPMVTIRVNISLTAMAGGMGTQANGEDDDGAGP